ncbi:MAG: flippase-like domain-containing protein [Bacteroidales bacterium]|nr:flippase-like domain-containing protein [Bacteroidales bacterium]
MLAKLGKTYNILLRLTIVVLTFVFLYDQVFYRKDLQSIVDYLPQVSSGRYFYFLLLVTVLLIPLNLLLEVVKWKLLISKLENVSVWNATKAVLTGVSVSMILPNRVGDYLGRVFVLKKANRLQAVLATILGSMAQLLTTILFGLTAVLFFFPFYADLSEQLNIWFYSGIIAVALITAVTSVFAFLNFSSFSLVLRRISGRAYRKISKYTEVFSWYNPDFLLKILGISIGRYLVFSFQFWLLLQAFQVPVSYFMAMVLVSLVYLLMAVIPTIALTEIGVRGSVSLFVFALYLSPAGLWTEHIKLGVAAASTMLWVFNLAFPALLGTFFVYSLRFFRKNNGHGN